MQNELNDNSRKKNHVLKVAGNFILMLSGIWIASVTCVLLLSRDSIVEMSINFFSPEVPPLLGSTVLNILLRKEFIVVPAIIIISTIVKEFKIEPLQRRVKLNLGLLFAAIFHFCVLGYLMFKPVLMATCSS